MSQSSKADKAARKAAAMEKAAKAAATAAAAAAAPQDKKKIVEKKKEDEEEEIDPKAYTENRIKLLEVSFFFSLFFWSLNLKHNLISHLE